MPPIILMVTDFSFKFNFSGEDNNENRRPVSALAPSGRRSPAKFRHACAPSSRVAACSTTARLRQVLEHPPCYDLVPAPLAADLGARRYRAVASACHRPQPPILDRALH